MGVGLTQALKPNVMLAYLLFLSDILELSLYLVIDLETNDFHIVDEFRITKYTSSASVCHSLDKMLDVYVEKRGNIKQKLNNHKKNHQRALENTRLRNFPHILQKCYNMFEKLFVTIEGEIKERNSYPLIDKSFKY
jgi:hypothetical protein